MSTQVIVSCFATVHYMADIAESLNFVFSIVFEYWIKLTAPPTGTLLNMLLFIVTSPYPIQHVLQALFGVQTHTHIHKHSCMIKLSVTEVWRLVLPSECYVCILIYCTENLERSSEKRQLHSQTFFKTNPCKSSKLDWPVR